MIDQKDMPKLAAVILQLLKDLIFFECYFYFFSYVLFIFCAAFISILHNGAFEAKKRKQMAVHQKWQEGAAEPLLQTADSLILPPAKDKKGFATGVTGSRIKLPVAARFCKPGRWYGTSCGTRWSDCSQQRKTNKETNSLMHQTILTATFIFHYYTGLPEII